MVTSAHLKEKLAKVPKLDHGFRVRKHNYDMQPMSHNNLYAIKLRDRFQDPSTVMCLTMAQRVIEPLESLNRSLQSAKATVAGMLESAKAVKSQLQRMREDAEFDKILHRPNVESKIKVLDLAELPRARKPPSRFGGLGEVFQSKSVCKYFRIEYLKLIDVLPSSSSAIG